MSGKEAIRFGIGPAIDDFESSKRETGLAGRDVAHRWGRTQRRFYPRTNSGELSPRALLQMSPEAYEAYRKSKDPQSVTNTEEKETETGKDQK